MEENTETGVSILIETPEHISERVLKTQETTGVDYPGHEGMYPHVTLYGCRFDEQKYEELLRKLKKMEASPFSVAIEGLVFQELSNDRLFVSLRFSDEEGFKELHEKIVAVANPLRGGLIRRKDVDRFKNNELTEKEWLATKKYGFRHFMEHYRPHITVGVIEKNDRKKAETLNEELKDLEGKHFLVDHVDVNLSTQTYPVGETVYASEVTTIPLT